MDMDSITDPIGTVLIGEVIGAIPTTDIILPIGE